MQSARPSRPARRQRPSRRPSQKRSWRRRLQNHLRTIFSRGDFSSLMITTALMVVTALALDAAEWTEGLSALAIVSVIAVGFGFLLSRSHYSEFLALVMSTIYSAAAIVLVNAMVLVDEGGIIHRTDTLMGQLRAWVVDALAGEQPANDTLAFVVFLSVLFWYLGHNAAWHIFRVDRVWRVILPTGLVLITNQFYYQGDNSLDIYLIIFVLLSILLLIRSHIDSREYEWFVHRISFPNYVRRAFFQAGGVLAVALVLLAWAFPTGADDKDLDRVKNLLSGDTFYDMADLWNRLFSSLEAEGIATADYYGGEELKLSGAIQLGDQPVMLVAAPNDGVRYYWRSTAYDVYDFGSWSWKHIRTVRAYTDNSGLELNIGPTTPGSRRPVDQAFTLLLRSSKLVYTAPQPVRLGLPVEIELDCVDDFGKTCVSERRQSDVAIIRARDTLRAGDSYSVTSSISTASADALRTAGQMYPEWVTRLYLQGANNMSPRVRELANQITTTSGAVTPYDRAKAIENWLRANITYNESIPAPPAGSDPIEWFLFDTRQGYCNYYATAMVLMLRAQGVPARMAAGFAQGAWDEAQGAFLVRERDAHTWVEVYFPGYGWVEFEPTADEAPINREGDETSQPAQVTATPWPTPPPLPTATPTIVPPTDAGGANATPTNASDSPFVPATPTPTPTPRPTATPPPLTKVNGDEGGGSNVLQTALLTLGLLALAVLGIVLAVVFAIWYVEYRGLGGLNIIERAYARMAIYGRWLGLRFEDSATPDERRRYMVSEIPEGEPPINAITHGYIQNRYAPPDPESERMESHIAQNAWREARWVFIRRKIAAFFGREPG